MTKPLRGVDLGPVLGPDWEVARLDAETALQPTVHRLREQGLLATGRAVVGDAGRRIVAVADELDADIIVMSTHAHVGVMRGLLGSVAGSVIRDAHRPVLLIHPTDAA